MMKQKIFYNKTTGEIIGAYAGPPEFLDVQESPDNSLSVYVDTDHPVTSEQYYVSNTNIVKKPPSPGDNYTFDYVTKSWVLDPKLAESYAQTLRKNLLLSSDWTQLPDVPLETKTAWAGYRQALRDITTQPGYPLDIVWPTPPQ